MLPRLFRLPRALLRPTPSAFNVRLSLRHGATAPHLSMSSHIPAPCSPYSTSASSPKIPNSSFSGTNIEGTEQGTEERTVLRQALGNIEPKLSITFTCTVEGCAQRSTHQFTKHAYEKGIVLVQCPGCKNRHLIADHLGWFKDSTENGTLRTVEDLLKARGESVKRGKIDPSGTIEFT